jgi:glycosyltransferase involved in cell wall biosynthesis
MRLAFLVYGGLDRVSGGFLYDRQVVGGLRTLGHTVEVVALPWWGYRRALASNLLPLPRGLDQHDLILEDELIHPAVFRRHRRLSAIRVPIVSLVHNLACLQPSTRQRWLVRRCERAYLGSVDGVVAVSESTLRDVRAQGGQAAPAVVAYAGRDHLPSTIDEAAVAARATAPGPLRVACVGVVAPHKGAHRLIEAIGRLPGEGVALELAGSLDADRAYVRRLRAMVAQQGLGKRVTFHGQLDEAGLRGLLAQSHVYALASDMESYPISAIEALGAGLPVLITTEGGTRELLGQTACGERLLPDDVAGWSLALSRLAEDRGRLRRMGHGALQRYRAHGTWLDTARVIERLCDRVLSSKT